VWLPATPANRLDWVLSSPLAPCPRGSRLARIVSHSGDLDVTPGIQVGCYCCCDCLPLQPTVAGKLTAVVVGSVAALALLCSPQCCDSNLHWVFVAPLVLRSVASVHVVVVLRGGSGTPVLSADLVKIHSCGCASIDRTFGSSCCSSYLVAPAIDLAISVAGSTSCWCWGSGTPVLSAVLAFMLPLQPNAVFVVSFGGDGSHSCACHSCGLQCHKITVGSISLGCC
jgi:hypothetical protein